MVDVKEKEYEELKKLGQKLHIPIPEAFWELEVTDKDGKVIQKHKQRSHSWTRNAYNNLASQLMVIDGNDTAFGAGKINIKDTAGSLKYENSGIDSTYVYTTGDVESPGSGYGFMEDAGEIAHGIVIGSGTNAESFEDYALQAQISNATMAHSISSAPVKSYDAQTKVYQVQHIRYFNNNSGGDVAVNEVALYTYSYFKGAGSWCVSRDKLASTVTVPNTGQLKVTYTIQLTYPA